MMRRVQALAFLVSAVLAVFIFSGRQASAFTIPCSEFLCGLALDCGDGDVVQCTRSGCTCRVACNADGECGLGQFCRLGLCVSRLPESCDKNEQCPSGQTCNLSNNMCFDPCNSSSDCTSPGQVCPSGQCRGCANDGECGSPSRRCVNSLCEAIAPTPTPAPQCTSDRQCNDGNPCNGNETCDGFSCHHGTFPCQRPPLPSTVKCVQDNPSGCFHCEFKWVAEKVPVAGDLELVDIDMTVHPRPIPTPHSGHGGFPPGGSGGGGGFRARGSFHARFASAPPLDLPSSSLHVALADEKGAALVDYVSEPGSWNEKTHVGWSRDANGAAVYRDERPGSQVRRLNLTSVPTQPDRQVFELEGSIDSRIEKPLAPQAKPRLAIEIAWKEASGVLALARFAPCTAGTTKGQPLRCATEASKK